ncbi:hypothetical protein GCM10011502_15430 [Oceanisphaera marina]|uniref:DUF4112 domain-containing protein n=1 Tax=Oceanisphaera marina TaxID=2017550 RepID=A0ABQ1IK36_9GAMM|nr:DUF4112 domain-containing protein [Oceanisphaera marina]GGB43006.1 hypothetical protein GCM10011502_15430 [Oceanisphaera marina]
MQNIECQTLSAKTASAQHASASKRLDRLAWLLDSAIRLPGGFRIGLDGIIGLVPGIGDLVGTALSSYLVVEAARLKLPFRLLARMAMNVLIELVVGVIPIVGDIFDFAFKANLRNMRILNEYLSKNT